MSEMIATDGRCPICHAEIRPGADLCWLCRAPLPARGGDWSLGGIGVKSGAASTAISPFQFSLASLMLLITLVSVLLGLSVEVPELGIPLGLLSIVAYPRSLWASSVRRERGEELGVGKRIGQFVLSLFIVWAVCIASCIAFFVACAATCGIGQNNEGAALSVGCVVGLATLAALTYFSWPKRRVRPPR